MTCQEKTWQHGQREPWSPPPSVLPDTGNRSRRGPGGCHIVCKHLRRPGGGRGAADQPVIGVAKRWPPVSIRCACVETLSTHTRALYRRIGDRAPLRRLHRVWRGCIGADTTTLLSYSSLLQHKHQVLINGVCHKQHLTTLLLQSFYFFKEELSAAVTTTIVDDLVALLQATGSGVRSNMDMKLTDMEFSVDSRLTVARGLRGGVVSVATSCRAVGLVLKKESKGITTIKSLV